MTDSYLVEQLDLIELQFNEVSALILRGDPASFQASCVKLQQLSAALKATIESGPTDWLKSENVARRVRILGERFKSVREALLRRSAQVQRALQIVVPVASPSTYASQGRYGSGPRQTGNLRGLSA